MIFLHLVVSFGWTKNWYIGDIPNAFLQDLVPGQILKLLKPLYDRPDVPRAWYNELSRILQSELGFQKSAVDPALFCLRDCQRRLRALMIIHVDDVMICHDGSEEGKRVAKLHERFPFATWMQVSEQPSGVTYCGKQIERP